MADRPGGRRHALTCGARRPPVLQLRRAIIERRVTSHHGDESGRRTIRSRPITGAGCPRVPTRADRPSATGPSLGQDHDADAIAAARALQAEVRRHAAVRFGWTPRWA